MRLQRKENSFHIVANPEKAVQHVQPCNEAMIKQQSGSILGPGEKLPEPKKQSFSISVTFRKVDAFASIGARKV